MHRPTLGVISLFLIVGGGILMLRPIDGNSYLGAIGMRSGLVLGAVWLALPNIRRMPLWLLYALAVLATVLIVRPRLVLYAFPVAAVVAILGATAGGRRQQSR